MKKIVVFAAVILFGVSACGDNTDSGQTYREQTHYDALIITDEQVWLRNYSTNKISQLYEQFNEKNHAIIVLGEYDSETEEYSEEIGSGTINNGKLSFAVNVPKNVLAWDKFKVFFNIITEGMGWNVSIDEEATNSTFIAIFTDDEDGYMLTKEGVSGTTSSVSDETVFFVYVDRDCAITGESREDATVMYVFNPFTLQLKKGWNTVWYKQTYTSSGRSSFSMDIKNPDLKWVLISTTPTN
jgi:hypothetical protein